jgi:Zn-dependent alcohol dehydrogenase
MGYLDTRRKDLEGIVTHRFALERIDEGFEAIKTGSALKVVIEP